LLYGGMEAWYTDVSRVRTDVPYMSRQQRQQKHSSIAASAGRAWQRPCSGMKRAAMICYGGQHQHSMSFVWPSISKLRARQMLLFRYQHRIVVLIAGDG